MHFTKEMWGNFVALFSVSYNGLFIFITGEQVHLIAGVLSLCFTVAINFRRLLRELLQLWRVFRAKNDKEILDLLVENLEKEKKSAD